MQNFAPDGAQLYREGTKWAKGHLYALIRHLAFHIRALIATAEPVNNFVPVNLNFSLPLKGHSQRWWNQGAGVLAPPKFQHPKGAIF